MVISARISVGTTFSTLLGLSSALPSRQTVQGHAGSPVLRGSRRLQAAVDGYAGCFQDGRSSYPFPPNDPERIFPERKEDSDEMTAELCMGLCDGQGFDYYGTQYGVECWCGEGTPEDTYLRYGELDAEACDIPCSGDSSESCGGSTIMSVYAYDDVVDGSTPAPVTDVSSPTPAPVTDVTEVDACNPNPCNLGACALDPGGGHICTCPDGWGGMSCQTDTTGLNEFSIELTFTINESVADDGVVWDDDEMADFRAWADKWENVITHVPCGDGILPIEAEWTSNFVLNPPSPRDDCPQISSGGKLSNSKGLKAWKVRDDVWESFVTHEMGHGVGFGYMWDKCTNCVIGDPEPLDGSWKPDECPSVYSTWLDLSGEPDGTVANIVETDSAGLTGECVHWDYDTIPGELNNKGTTHVLNENGETSMSKLTLAALEDIGYIVDPSQAEPFEIA
ncbi:unnamed protein product [Scytosiphon promiscuus]